MDTDRVDGLAGVALDELIARLEADAAAVAAAVSGTPSTGAGQERWVARAAACQRVLNTVTGAQDAVIVRSACIEWQLSESTGELIEVHRGLGYAALDAPDLLAPALGASHAQASRRVQRAVRIAGDGPAHPTGLGGLQAAMLAGRLEGWVAEVVADELSEAPPEVAESVVAALDSHFGVETVSELKRRTRRMVAAISPDLLKQRAARVRAECGLRRFVDEPGVDTWIGNFPSEDALHAWAAIDELAQDYVRDGVCPTIERARGKALTDLVTKQATIITHLHLTTPATAPTPTEPTAAEQTAAESAEAGRFVEVVSSTHSRPVLVPKDWVSDLTDKTPAKTTDTLACDPETGAVTDPDGDRSSDAYRIPEALARLIRARDGHCRFPGCTVHARFCDLDHARAWPLGPTGAWNLLLLCRRHHRIKQTPGWTLTLHPDGVVTWTDPHGRRRTTAPVDHLRPFTLPGDTMSSDAMSCEKLASSAKASGSDTANAADTTPYRVPETLWPTHARLPGEDLPFSRLQHHLEHLAHPNRVHLHYPGDNDPAFTITDQRPLRHRARAAAHGVGSLADPDDDDPPPF